MDSTCISYLICAVTACEWGRASLGPCQKTVTVVVPVVAVPAVTSTTTVGGLVIVPGKVRLTFVAFNLVSFAYPHHVAYVG